MLIMFRTVSVSIVLLLALTLIGCTTAGRNITDIAGSNPQYLTKAEVIDLINDEVLRETAGGGWKYLRRYVYPDGRYTLEGYSDPGVIQKTFWGHWTVEDDGLIRFEHSVKYATIPVRKASAYSTTGKESTYIVKIGHSKYSYVDPITRKIHRSFYIEWL